MLKTFQPIHFNNLDIIRKKILENVMIYNPPGKPYPFFTVMENKHTKTGNYQIIEEPNFDSPLRKITELCDELKRLDIYDCWSDTAIFIIPSQGKNVTTNSAIHVDFFKHVYSILIPLTDCTDTYTAFYEAPEGTPLKEIRNACSSFPYFIFNNKDLPLVKEVGRVSLEESGPVVFNNSCPHNIITDPNAKMPRITASLRFFNEEKVLQALSK